MRGGRSLLFLLLVAIGLGAYVYFVEMERDPAGTETKPQAFDVLASDIATLTIRGSAGETATLRRTDESWTMVEPVATGVDRAVVDSILSSLETMEVDRVVDENPTDLEQYGLTTPQLQIDFTTAAGATHVLAIGHETPTGSGLYARIDRLPRLLVVPAFLKATFDKAPFALRDRRAVDVAREAIDRLTLQADGESPVELRRERGEWRLTAPVPARADDIPVDSLIGRLTGAQMSSIVLEGREPTAAELRTFGLATPAAVVTIGTADRTTTLALGGAKDDSAIYARDLARPVVFTVDTALLADLTPDPDDLRVRDIFAFNAFSAQTIALTHGATSVAYAKSPSPSGADEPAAAPIWSRTKPTPGEVNQTALTDLLNALSSLRAEQFTDRAITGGEVIDVAVTFGSSDTPNEERVTLRRAGTVVHAVRPGEPGAAVVPGNEFDVVLGHLKTLTAPAAPAPATAAGE